MTLGRPASIPEKFIRVDPPCILQALSPGADLVQDEATEYSCQFYKATM